MAPAQQADAGGTIGLGTSWHRPQRGRTETAFGLAIPLGRTAMCVTLLARSGMRALCICVGAAAVLAMFVLGVPY